jgi:hypothetical protein
MGASTRQVQARRGVNAMTLEKFTAWSLFMLVVVAAVALGG